MLFIFSYILSSRNIRTDSNEIYFVIYYYIVITVKTRKKI